MAPTSIVYAVRERFENFRAEQFQGASSPETSKIKEFTEVNDADEQHSNTENARLGDFKCDWINF